MEVKFIRPDWYSANLTDESIEASNLLVGTWRESANLFSINKELREKLGKPAPLGIQPYLNQVIQERFTSNDWFGEDGRFIKNGTWVRITFRHQMSLGSDFLDALRLPRIEKVHQCVIMGASDEFLEVITPRDWRSLCSFPKLVSQMQQLKYAFDPPLLIGELKPISKLDAKLHKTIYGERLSI